MAGEQAPDIRICANIFHKSFVLGHSINPVQQFVPKRIPCDHVFKFGSFPEVLSNKISYYNAGEQLLHSRRQSIAWLTPLLGSQEPSVIPITQRDQHETP